MGFVKECRTEILVFSLLALSALLATFFYVASERYFYISDFNYYHLAAVQAVKAFKTQPLIYPLLLMASTGNTHNMLFTLPLTLCMAMVGVSRAAFVCSLVFCFTLPYLAIISTIVSRCRPEQGKKLFFSTLLFLFFLPVFWVPAWRGYPDHLAAMQSLIVVLYYLLAGRRMSTRFCFTAGILLALAPLLRRHYFYSDIALIVSLFIDQMLAAREEGKSLLQAFVSRLKPFLLLGGTLVGFLATFGFLFLRQVLSNNYGSLYKSAATPSLECLGYFFSSYSIPVVLSALLGFVWALRSHTMVSHTVRFLALYSGVLALMWPAVGTHIAHHYLLYWMPFVGIGNALLLYQLFTLNKLLLLPVAIYGACNLFIGLSPLPLLAGLPFHPARWGMLRSPIAAGDTVSLFFSPAYGPLQRSDFDEVKRLIQKLRADVPEHGKVLPGASWDTAEADAMRNAERHFYGADNTVLTFLNQPYSDSSESYPLERILASCYVLPVTPVFYLYSKPGEKLADMFVEIFEKKWEISKDFERQSDVYKLDGGYTMEVYRRVKPTSPQCAARTLTKMVEYLPERPDGEPPFVNTDNVSETVGEKKRADYAVLTNSDVNAVDEPHHYIMSTVERSGKVTVNGVLRFDDDKEKPSAHPDILQVSIDMMALDKDGNKLALVSQDLPVPGEFTLSLNLEKPAYLVLSTRTQAAGTFELQFKELQFK